MPAFFLLCALVLLTGCGSSTDSPTSSAPERQVEWISPASGSVLSGSIDLLARADEADRVRFYCGNDEIGSSSRSPYLLSWDSTPFADGPHTLSARAEWGAETSEDQIAVTLDNHGGGDGGISVTVTPPSATVTVGHSLQFHAAVAGTDETTVTWSVDQGPAAGSIDNTGLYTAPAQVPVPPAVTIRAASTVDPTRSGTALVTVAGGDGGGGGGAIDEGYVMHHLFSAGYDAGDLVDQTIDLVAQAVWAAAEANGGTATFHGTLTQNGESWTYSSSPGDRLVVAASGALPVEFQFSRFDGHTTGTWEEFTDAHDLEIQATAGDQFDIHLASLKYYTGSPVDAFAPRRFDKASSSPTSFTRSVDQTLRGSITWEGVALALDLHHTGTEEGSVESGWASLTLNDRITGGATSTGFTLQIDESEFHSVFDRSSPALHTQNHQIYSNSTAMIGDTAYRFQDGFVAWAAGSVLEGNVVVNVVIDANYWEAGGTLFKDGQPYGAVKFDRPVILDSHGPELVLDLGSGNSIFLHTLIVYP